MKAKTWTWNQMKSESESFSKKSYSSINLLCFSIIAKSFSKNSGMALSFKGPSHPTQMSLDQFLMMKMSWSKFSIPSLDCFKLMMTPTTLNICSIQFVIPQSQILNERNMGKLHNMLSTHQIKQFSISIGYIANCWYTCNSISRWTWLHHHLIQVIIFNYYFLIYYCYFNKVQLKKKKTYNKKKAHNISVIIYDNLNGMCNAHKILYDFHVCETRVQHDNQHVMGLGLIVSWSKCQKWGQNIVDLCLHL